ncbi:cyclic GMP-AMP synthase-like isoform X1 [Phyllobates terribilis]|uniref:cyclic GMP-AMP synthase-like isoform X1 n=1 Tax=Phyllobates terribilis TaxID=111132 RepID=UPI003CCB5CC3
MLDVIVLVLAFVIAVVIKQQKLSQVKYKSIDDRWENGQRQGTVVSQKEVYGKTSKEENMKTANLDNGDVTRRNGKRANSRTPRRLKDVVDELRLRKNDISNAADKVNTVVDAILKSVKHSKGSIFEKIKKISTGSYYERVKILKPNEFDIMIQISQRSSKSIIMTNLDKKGPYYTLSFKDRKPSAMLKYLNLEGNISASEIVKEFRHLIKQAIGKPGMEKVYLHAKNSRSPAETLLIKNEPQDISVDLVIALKIINEWPEETNFGMNIDDWLGMKVKQEYKRSHFYMVPKRAVMGNKTKKADIWRISFSNIEKKIITKHGNDKNCCGKKASEKKMCCRKQCLKLLKYLLELLKTNGEQRKMNQFCSYHAKTALLHFCVKHPKDEDWKFKELELHFNKYVDFFLDCLSRYTLYNFFIPAHNLFSEEFVDKSNCDYLYEEIRYQKLNNYPIFYE